MFSEDVVPCLSSLGQIKEFSRRPTAHASKPEEEKTDGNSGFTGAGTSAFQPPVNTSCCNLGFYTLGMVQGGTLEEPTAVILHGGVCEGGRVDGVMVDLNGHAAGNGRHSQGIPKARRPLLYSEMRVSTNSCAEPQKLTSQALFCRCYQSSAIGMESSLVQRDPNCTGRVKVVVLSRLITLPQPAQKDFWEPAARVSGLDCSIAKDAI
jgi:hypothetical protein